MNPVLEGKISTDGWFPIVLRDSTDFISAITGKVFGDITCKYSYVAAVSLTVYSVTTAEWKEAGEGKYWLKIGDGEFVQVGKYNVSVDCAGCIPFDFTVEARARTYTEHMEDILDHIADNYDSIDDVIDIVTPTATAVNFIKAKTDNLPANTTLTLTALQSQVDDNYDGINDTLGVAVDISAALVVVDGIVDDIKSYLVDGGRIDLLLDIIIAALVVVDGIVDAIKLKTDTLGGSGAIEWEYTLTEAVSGDPISDADIWVSTDIAGTNVVASGTTDAYGKVTFYLDAGTAYIWRQKSGFNFTNPDTEVIA